MDKTTARACARSGCLLVIPAEAHANTRYCSPACRSAQNAPGRRDQARSAKRLLRAQWTTGERAAANAATRAWRAQNPDRVRANNRAAYLANPQAFARQRDEWRKSNPDKFATQARNASHIRRVRKLAGGQFVFTSADWRSACAHTGFRCAYCSTQAPLTMEHVVPLSRGGRHSVGNIVPACEFCNKSKGALLLTEWRMSRRAKG